MIKLTMNELGCVFFALNMGPDGKARTFSFSELGKVSELSKKLNVVVVDGKIPEGVYEFEFNTEEKKFLLDNLKEIKWQMGDAAIVVELTSKLE